MVIKDSFGRKIFILFNTIFMIGMMAICLYPFLYVLFASLSDSTLLVINHGFLYKPLGFSFDAYFKVFENPMISRSYLNTIYLIVVGVTVNIVMTCLGAYILSRKNFLWKNALMVFIIITMYFNGGLIPNYLNIKDLHLIDKYWALILPGAINTMNLIIMRTAFMGIPDSLEESAKIDGASHFTIMSRIIIPLSASTIAVMILFYGVGHWNSWFSAMIYLKTREKYPLQLILREILIMNDLQGMAAGTASDDVQRIGESIKHATIIVATVPILILYPFLQKYFVKGVMVGALKG